MMKQNEIEIEINTSVDDVFNYLIDPQYAPRWIDGLIKEETNEWPTKLGSLYRDSYENAQVFGGVYLVEYQITEFTKSESFEFKQLNSPYHVKYTLKSIPGGTKLNYLEWVDEEEIENPFTKEMLEKFKLAIENGSINTPNQKEAVMIELTRYTIKKGKSHVVDEWYRKSNKRMDEVLKTLEDEHMLVETVFRQADGDNEYLFWFAIQGQGGSLVIRSNHEVDNEYLKFVEDCIEPDSRVDLKLESTMIPNKVKEFLLKGI